MPAVTAYANGQLAWARPAELEGTGRFAVVADPGGAAFQVIARAFGCPHLPSSDPRA